VAFDCTVNDCDSRASALNFSGWYPLLVHFNVWL